MHIYVTKEYAVFRFKHQKKSKPKKLGNIKRNSITTPLGTTFHVFLTDPEVWRDLFHVTTEKSVKNKKKIYRF